MGCSYLELMIGLSRRLAFETSGDARVLFWELIRNVGLRDCNDKYKNDLDTLVEEVTDQITHRTYAPDGRGGFFPLRRPEEDQTNVELWYQLCAYVLENTDFGR